MLPATIFKRNSTSRCCSLKSLPAWLGAILCFSTTYLFSQSYFKSSLFRRQSPAPLIVAWTAYFRDTISAKLNSSMVNCAFRCDIVERNSDYGSRIPSAYIFHGRDIDVSDLPTRYSHQLMVFMLFESPAYAGKVWRKLPVNYFNATMTYRNDSDYPLPYGKFVGRAAIDDEQTFFTQEQIRKALQKKTRGALLLVSNCFTKSKRETVIRRLSHKINITIAGRCGSIFPRAKEVFCPKPVGDRKCEDDLTAKHRFYLAFENSLCRNYITEKFFRRISQLMIPIVLNRKFYEDNGIPPDSFIAVDDFRNDDELAKHLKFVEQNNTAFLKYFEWTRLYRKPSSYVSDAACRLCADIHKEKRLHVANIQAVNRYKNQCTRSDILAS